MTFARVVFWIAGAFGMVALIRLYLGPAPDNLYYGFLATLVAWQIAFFVIGADPMRFRPMMIPAVLEKMLWMLTLAVLYAEGRSTAVELGANAATHGLLGVLFIVAFFRTPSAERRREVETAAR